MKSSFIQKLCSPNSTNSLLKFIGVVIFCLSCKIFISNFTLGCYVKSVSTVGVRINKSASIRDLVVVRNFNFWMVVTLESWRHARTATQILESRHNKKISYGSWFLNSTEEPNFEIGFSNAAFCYLSGCRDSITWLAVRCRHSEWHV